MTSLRKITLRTLILSLFALALCQSAAGEILIKIPGVQGRPESSVGYSALAEDMRIEVPDPDVRSADADRGVVVLSLPNSKTTRALIESGLEGREIPEIEILVAQPSRKGEPVVYLKYKLDRCFVKSWSTTGDAGYRPTEEIAFYYNKLEFSEAMPEDLLGYK